MVITIYTRSPSIVPVLRPVIMGLSLVVLTVPLLCISSTVLRVSLTAILVLLLIAISWESPTPGILAVISVRFHLLLFVDE